MLIARWLCDVFSFTFFFPTLRPVTQPGSPITEAYRSAYSFASTDMTSAAGGEFASRAVTRAEYLESGCSASRKKFVNWNTAEDLDCERVVPQDRDRDTSSHKDDYSATAGAPATTNKERDMCKDGVTTKGGRGRHQRDDQQRQTPRGDDRTTQNLQVPSGSAGGRLTRTRISRAGNVDTSK